MSVGLSNVAANFETQARARMGNAKVDASRAQTMDARYQAAKNEFERADFERQARAYFGDAKVDASRTERDDFERQARAYFGDAKVDASSVNRKPLDLLA